MANPFRIIDVATAPMRGAADFLEEPQAPSNWKDPEKIAAYVAEKRAEGASRCGLDLDLCCITGIGEAAPGEEPIVTLCRTEDEEKAALDRVRHYIGFSTETRVVSFNGLKFDLPVLARRCAYLGLPMPRPNLDRYRSPHVDLFNVLTHNGTVTGHALGWYVKRLGWTDLTKVLSGAEESQVPESGRWDDLAASIRHDVIATDRLAQWLGVR